MRLAADEPLGMFASIYLDGAKVHDCVEADEDEGWVRVLVIGEEGETAVFESSAEIGFVTVKLAGRVRITFE